MDLLVMVLLLLVCLLVSNIISHYIPSIPTALIQIALGIILTFIFKDISFELESEWFLLLFIAPLLFNDGRHFPREALWKMKVPILGNAIVLVLITTIGGGYFIHWMIPDIPIAAAFALAAILSPTDPVAVNGIAKRIHIPEKVLNLVRGESLINDASGLVAFNYAVVAVVTGYFSIKEAFFDFTYVFIAGAIIGLVLIILITWITFVLRKKGITDVTFHSLLQVLTPFIIYIVTEELLHASGVIAVVVAGVTHSLTSARTEKLVAEEKVLTENIWSIVLFVLNGVVFLLLGLNIPSSMLATVANPNINNWLAIEYVLAIGVVILSIRFVWTFLFSFYQFHLLKTTDADRPSFRTSLLISLTGVRGAVTMAGVLSIPFIINSGELFPERSLILFIAAGVILFTLIVATVFLPLLSKDSSSKAGVNNKNNIAKAKQKILLAAIKKMRHEMNEENEPVVYELMSEYRMMFEGMHLDHLEDKEHYRKKIMEIRLLGLKAERKYIHDLMEDNQIDQEVFDTFEQSLEHREEMLSTNVSSGAKYIIGRAIRGWYQFNGKHRKETGLNSDKLRLGKHIQLKAIQAAIATIKDYSVTSETPDIAQAVILDYKRILSRSKEKAVTNYEIREEQKEALRLMVMDIERQEIHSMLAAGEISSEEAKELRRFVNYIESVTLYEYME